MSAERLFRLFQGMDEVHGRFTIDKRQTRGDGKRQGKAMLVREPVTLELWEKHLEGEQGIGIVPIRKDNTCSWGVIDIDDYQLNIEDLAKNVAGRGLPLFPLRSKSGGCHLAVFLKEPIPAVEVQQKLREIAANLGHGRSEIFPKQSSVLYEKGDVGSWLNMPYFGGDNGTRYCLDGKGKALDLEKFLDKAEAGLLTRDEFLDIELEDQTKDEVLEDLVGGPPCLHLLSSQGFPQGTRNNGLFALGVYARKAFPDTWEQKIEELNQKYMDPPLESKEVQVIQKQVGKKSYNYKCNDQPLANFCNAGACRGRPHGVGGGSLVRVTGMQKLATDQPVYFLNVPYKDGVGEARLEMTVDELHSQERFHKVCIAVLDQYPQRVSDAQWRNMVQDWLDNMEYLDPPKDASVEDQFFELLEEFCRDSHLLAMTKEELLLGKAYEEDNRIYFRVADLEEHMLHNNFKHYTRSKIVGKLIHIKPRNSEPKEGVQYAGKQFFNIKGRGTNTRWVSTELFDRQNESFDTPDMSDLKEPF